jgi:hypothetical protein
MAYDDLMGLDMYDDGMGGLYSAEMLKDQVIAAGASAASILLAAWALPKLSASEMLSKMEEPNRHRVAALVGILGGMIGGRLLWDKNRDAAMAIVGGVSGLGLAQLIDSYFEKNLIGGGATAVYPLGSFAAAGDDSLSQSDQALLAAYGSDDSGMGATSVRASRGAFGGLHGTVVNPEALMGFNGLDAAVVAGETLGENYNPYMS